ncbi:MAG: porin [Alphaproteobacteria bacterium]|nr:porin [Alphaproteobacteria bacterium]
MKKLLIATSAIVGLGLVSADFAAAELETSFSGLVRIRLVNGAQANNGVTTGGTSVVPESWSGLDKNDDCILGKNPLTIEVNAWGKNEAATNPAASNNICYLKALGVETPTNYSIGPTLGVNRAQLQWDVKGTSDSGLTYGARIRVRPTSGAGGRVHTYVYFGSNFGQFTVGHSDGITGSAYVGVGMAGAGSGGLDGAGIGFSQPSAGASLAKIGSPVVDASYGANSRLAYKSPTISGLRVHAEYALGDGVESNGADAGHVAAALTYSADLSDGSFNAIVSYLRARADDTLADTSSQSATTQTKKVAMVGLDSTFGPVTIGANYLDLGNSGGLKKPTANKLKGSQRRYMFSVKYNFGPGAVSLAYARATAAVYKGSSAATAYTDRVSGYTVGLSYSVAPGWSVYGDLNRGTAATGRVAAAGKSASASATTWLLGTNVSF